MPNMLMADSLAVFTRCADRHSSISDESFVCITYWFTGCIIILYSTAILSKSYVPIQHNAHALQ